jgi:hypothetical protein
MNTNPAVVKPADTVSSIENFLAIATAAMAWQESVHTTLRLTGLMIILPS